MNFNGPPPGFPAPGHPQPYAAQPQAYLPHPQAYAPPPVAPPPQPTGGPVGGAYLYLGNEASLQAGMRGDLESKLLRRCAKCKAHAVTVVNVTFHYVNGITRGRTYDNRCGACGATFKTESVLRAIVELSAGIVCALIGAGVLAGASGWTLLVGLLLPFGLYMTGLTLSRVIARFRNPPVPRIGG